MVFCCDLGAPAVFDDDRLMRLDDEGRPIDARADMKRLARKDIRLSPGPMRKEACRAGGNGRRGRWRWVNPFDDPRRAAYGLDRHRLDDDRLAPINEAEAAFVGAFERAPHCRRSRERNLDRRIGTRIAQLRAAMDLDRLVRDPLPFHLGDRRAREPIHDCRDPNERFDAKGLVDSLRPLRGDVGQSHPIGRKQRRKWMDEDG